MQTSSGIDHLQLLRLPASRFVGERAFSVRMTRAVESIVARAAEAMSAVLGRNLELTTSGMDTAPASFTSVFGARFVLGDAQALTIGLDFEGARALADWIGSDLANLVGAGSLGEIDRALLEYAFLRGLDRIGMPANLVLTEFLGFATAWETGFQGRRWFGQLRCAGRRGLVFAAIGKPLLEAVERAPFAAAPDAASTASIEVSLALPEIPLSEAEVPELEPGDVLLTGLAALDAEASGLSLVTPTGWRICDANLVTDSPTLVIVEAGTAELRPAWSGIASVAVILGATQTPISRFSSAAVNRRIAIPKHASSPARICCGDRTIGSGELVRVDGEVGVRLLAVHPTDS